MRFRHVGIDAVAYSLPDEIVTSLELEHRLSPVYERFRLHPGRLELMTGIRERRFWPPGEPPSAGSTRAGRLALDNACLSPSDIDVLIHTSVSRDFLEPATASVVHHNLGLPPHCGFYDISNACLGFLNGMICVGNMIEMGQVRRGLIVAGESSRQLVETTIHDLLQRPDLTRADLKNAFASLTIGSGAVAMILAHDSVSQSGHRLVGGAVRAATQHKELCQGSADTGFGGGSSMLMSTDSEALLAAGCELAGQTWHDFKTTLSWADQDISRCFTHQVGVAHRDRLYHTIGRDPSRDFATLEFLGNVGSVSLPLTLAMGMERHPPAPGDKIALLGIGSGLSCIMLGLHW